MKPVSLCFAVLTLLNGCQALDHGAILQDHDHGDAPAAVHGMVLFGTDELYASHIPMFAVPHDWQAIFGVELSHPSVDAKAVYLAAVQSGTQPLVTLKPKPFVLPKLLGGEITAFEATMHQGNFEQGGPVLLSGLTVTVSEVKYQQHLSPQTPGLSELSYLPVAVNGNGYLVHKITAPDNFDHVVQVQWANGDPIVNGATMNVFAFKDKTDSLADKLKAGQLFKVEQDASVWKATEILPADVSEDDLTFKVISDFYCTPGPEFFGACP